MSFRIACLPSSLAVSTAPRPACGVAPFWSLDGAAWRNSSVEPQVLVKLHNEPIGVPACAIGSRRW